MEGPRSEVFMVSRLLEIHILCPRFEETLDVLALALGRPARRELFLLSLTQHFQID